MKEAKIAIMQPYFFPYLSYFHMLNEADVVVLYDDVNFIERGWINRNNILLNGEKKLISLPLIKSSSNRLIKDIKVNNGHKDYYKVLKTLEFAYSNSNFFEVVFPEIKNLFHSGFDTISEFNRGCIEWVFSYLNIEKKIIESSSLVYNKVADKVEKINEMSKVLNAKELILPSGSAELYTSSDFEIDSYLIESEFEDYPQIKVKEFHSGLSIIDLLMNLDKDKILNQLRNYKKLNLSEHHV